MGMLCSVVGWVCCALLWVKDGFKGVVMAEQYSSFMSSGTKCILKISDANVRCHGGQKKWGTRAH